MPRTHTPSPGNRRAKVGILLLTLALGACAGAPPREAPPSTAHASADLRFTVTALAKQMIGVPYRYGGADPVDGFDCSGLVFYAYSRSGVAVPRTSQEQFKAARKIGLHQAAHGDLIFFQDQEKLSHVGIYLGDGLFVHAPSSGKVVSVASLAAPYYQRHLVAVGRVLPN